jgi:multidrug efflux system outer membrane protein
MIKRLSLLALLALAGCASVPELRQPELDLPAASQPAPTIAADWWQIYGDPVLDALIAEALAHNADLRLAAVRIEEARAYLGLAQASLYPEVSAGASAARDRRTEVGAMPAPSNPVSNTFSVDLRAFYEVDLWGRYRSASAAARAELLASQYGREVVYTTLTASVAKGYFALRSLDAQIALARDTLENRRQALALMQRRFAAGEISELEVRLAEAEVAGIESALAQRVQQTRLVETALAGLLGRQPRQIVAEQLPRGLSLQALALPPEIPAGLPSELLARRPDVRQAEANLAAARARIDQAKAALYPSVGLTAYLGSESRALTDLFSGPATVWGIAASLVQTVFDAGRNEAALQATVARQEMVLIGYEETVKRAFREALDALIVYRQARERAEAEARQSEALRRSLTLADLRYRYGESGYLEVLYAQRNLFDSEQKRILARELQLIALADLFRALGGGWNGDAIAKAAGAP